MTGPEPAVPPQAAETEREQAAAADLMVASPETSITGTALRGFASLLRQEAGHD